MERSREPSKAKRRAPPDAPRLGRGRGLPRARGRGPLDRHDPPRSGTALIGGPFQLQTAEGKTITEADLKGHPFLVYFGYTHCPDVCPTTLAQIDVLQRLPDKPICALFVTVDPERDTPALMADYVSSFDSRIVGLSGTPDRSPRWRKLTGSMRERRRPRTATIRWITPR